MIKKPYLFLVITAVITFAGGFLFGVFYQQERSDIAKVHKMAKVPESAKTPQPKQEIHIEEENTKVLIGYVQDFRDPATINYSQLTHVIFSFGHPAKDGSLLINGDSAMTNLRTMVNRAHEQNTKAILAIGGWYHIQGGESYDYFKTAISNSKSRSKLINQLMDITKREKLDGIDIDFEHPRSKEDAGNLAIFTKGLSNQLHSQKKELSIAVNAKIHSVAGTEITSVVYEPTMFKNVDHVNIMAYDGQWDGEYNAANLSPYSYAENIVNYWSNLLKKQGISNEKLVLGVPSYAQPDDVSIKQTSYAAILKKNPKNAVKDTVSMNGTTYHYNGTATIQKKSKLALEHGFGGMMIWELGHDATGAHSLTNTISTVLEKQNKDQQQFAYKINP